MASDKLCEAAVIVGTRPNIIKLAPFLREAKKHPNFRFTLIHTGQHFDQNMSHIFFDQMGIPSPNITLTPSNTSPSQRIGSIINKLDNVFKKHSFDITIVFGDVDSTLIGALIASKHGSKIVHIEAGLRSHDRRMPEEINRTIVDHLSDLLFTTEESANENLLSEGIKTSKIKYVGNILVESIGMFWDKINASNITNNLNLTKQGYLIGTIHRHENTDNPHTIKSILEVLNELSSMLPIIFPIHPGTERKIRSYQLDSLLSGLHIIEPLGYLDFMKLIIDSKGVITDSGGIQEETSYLGIPCCTLRDNTERPITITTGSNILYGINTSDTIMLKNHLNNTAFDSYHIPLWDNEVSSRIFSHLIENYT